MGKGKEKGEGINGTWESIVFMGREEERVMDGQVHRVVRGKNKPPGIMEGKQY